MAKANEALQEEQTRILKSLHTLLGYPDAGALSVALARIAYPNWGKGGRPKKKAKQPRAAKPSGKRAKKRAVLTDAIREETIKLLKSGKSGAEVANLVGVATATVANIKKAAGLVKQRTARKAA